MICSNKCYKFTGGYCRASWEGWKWPKKKSPNFDCLKKKKLPKKDCLKACSKFALYCLFVVINISSLQRDIDVLLGRVGDRFGGELFFLDLVEIFFGDGGEFTWEYCHVRESYRGILTCFLGGLEIALVESFFFGFGGDIDVLLGRVGDRFGGELFFWIWWRYFL